MLREFAERNRSEFVAIGTTGTVSGLESDPAISKGIDYSRRWLVLVAVSTGVILATIDASIVNVAFPTLVDELDTTFNTIQWVALGYLLTIATFTLGMGRLGDVVGKKSLYVAGYGVFTVASAACGFAPDVGWLIGFRIVQAFGAVMILSLGSAILVEAFPAKERGKALGWIGTAVSLGIISGPVAGGLLISAFSWRAIFFVNIPFGIIGTFLALRYVHRTPPAPGQRFDLLGAILMSVALFSLSFALTVGQDLGFASPPILAAFAVSLVAGVVFVFVELRVESPMIQLRLFRNPMLSVSVITGFLVFAGLASTFFLLPFYLEGVLGYDVGTVGLLMGAAPLVLGVISPLSGTLSDRIGIRPLTLAGLVIVALSFAGFLTFDVDTTIPHYLVVAVMTGVGVAVFQSPNNSAIMGSMPPEYIGLGGGVLTITRVVGQITGIAVLGSIWAAATIAANGGVTPDGGASGATPAAQVAGLQVTYSVAAGLAVAAVLVGVWGLRREREDRRSAASVAT